MALLACGVVLPGCAASSGAGSPAEVQRLRVEPLSTLPHDPTAFTQGLELSGGTLYEGTGLVGRSSVRAGSPGATPLVRVDLPGPLFGEGITVVGPRLWQLTWRDGVAIERDATTLHELRRIRYDGEGWGLCHQADPAGGVRLVMSDGTGRLTFRDPRTFAITGTVDVTLRGRAVDRLNELECVGGDVYANIWQSDTIVRIDSTTGTVTAQIDADGLLGAEERRGTDVLNGIAAVPGTQEFLITGKLWPRTFRVRFVPA